jgi:hypothetical protein
LAGEMMDNNLLLMPSKLFGDKNNAFRLSYAVDDMILKKGLEILTTLLG